MAIRDRFGRAVSGGGSRARSYRWAFVALGAMLLLVCSLAIAGSHRISNSIDHGQEASAVSDLSQDVRFYATEEGAALQAYRIDGLASAVTDRRAASTALDDALLQLQATTRDSGNRASIADLLVQHKHADRLSAQEIRLVRAGKTAHAARLFSTRLSPALLQFTTDIGSLEDQHHQDEVSLLLSAHRDGALLEFGAPVLLGLSMLLLAGYVLVTRNYRRTVERQALHDALTGLPNRVLFADRVAHALRGAARTGARPVVMLLDLDHFKDVNDTLGHHYGDQLLIDVAARLSETVRPGDTVARLGGDEFAVLLPDGGAAAGTTAAARILSSLEVPFTVAGITVGMEASIGIATAQSETSESFVPPGEGDTLLPDLLQQADTAMYLAKKDRSGSRHYTPGESSTPAHLALLGELRQAFEFDELVLHYQPKVGLDTGELVGVEALVRWRHPTRGLLYPGAFIDLAEATTLIHRLTSIVLDKSLELCRDWLDHGVTLPVAVNISARSLLENGFAEGVAARLAAAQVPARMLCLELTESTMMSDPDGALSVLQQLHDMGVRLSVDDFGTGYSSMAYLKVLPVDELKVDRSFVKDMVGGVGDNVLVQSAVDLGHNLGLSVVAEGVEDHETLDALRAVGVDIVQGFYLGRPMDAERLGLWIDHHGGGIDLVTAPTQAA